MITRSRNDQHRQGRSLAHRLAPLAVVMLVGGCAADYPYATVDGAEISREDVYAYADVDASAPSVPADQVRAGMTDLVYDAAAVSAAEADFGIVITPEDVASRAADPPARWQAALVPSVSGEEFPEVVVESIAVRTLLVDTVGVELVRQSYGTWEDLIATSPELVTRVCIRHLVVPTEDEAAEALERIEGGEDFAAVAAEVSLDTASPGGLFDAGNCPSHILDAGPEFVEVMLDVPVGELGGPVESSAGFHVIRVEERITPTAAELEADPPAYLELNTPVQAFSQWFTSAASGADVEVASEVGYWSPERLGVVAPGG